MRQGQAFGHTCGDRHGPVDPRRDHSADALGARKALDRRFILRRDDRAAVCVSKSRRRGVAVERDHVQLAAPRRSKEAQLSRPGA
jgi:hypothetical protein